jgi:NAD(P)-dependent dehydrogenase (short-subunit alcohol dehydrogenase family)
MSASGRPDHPLAGRVAVVTGGAAGLGRAIALGLAADGGAAAILDIDADGAAATVAELDDLGLPAWGGGCDVADESSVAAAFAALDSALGPASILVNNAGLYEGFTGGFGDLGRGDRQRLFAVNVHAVVTCTLEAAVQMRASGGGTVVNLCSDAGFHSRTPYGVSKLAVRGLTVALATELAADRIRVNAVAPGLVGTDHALAHLGEQQVRDRVAQRQLVARLGDVGDVVEAVRFLVSDRASFITGETLRVNGGGELFV